MSQYSASRVQEALTILERMEKDLDEVERWVSEAKRILLGLAASEGEKAMSEALNEANAVAQERLEKARLEAEKEAERIIQQSRSELDRLKAKIERSMEKAITLAMDAILGEKKV